MSLCSFEACLVPFSLCLAGLISVSPVCRLPAVSRRLLEQRRQHLRGESPCPSGNPGSSLAKNAASRNCRVPECVAACLEPVSQVALLLAEATHLNVTLLSVSHLAMLMVVLSVYEHGLHRAQGERRGRHVGKHGLLWRPVRLLRAQRELAAAVPWCAGLRCAVQSRCRSSSGCPVIRLFLFESSEPVVQPALSAAACFSSASGMAGALASSSTRSSPIRMRS